MPVHGAAFGTAPSVLFIAGGATRPGATSILSWTGVTQIYSTIPMQML
jgi:hypothetical protein